MKSTRIAVLFPMVALASACGMESASVGDEGVVTSSSAELLGKRRPGIQLFTGTFAGRPKNRPEGQPTRRNVVKDVCEALADPANPAHDKVSRLLCEAPAKVKAIVEGLPTDPPTCGFQETVCKDDNQQNRSNIDVHIGTCESCFAKCEDWCGGCKRAYCGMIWCTMIC